MLRVGLTGGIGSGKSEVARLLAALGAVVVDSDALAREVVGEGTPGLAAVRAAFGETVLDADGGLDRAALGRTVFADPSARGRLEDIVHPLVRAEARRREAAAVARDPGALVVHDVPLLVETGQQDAYDVVIVVDAAEDLRVRRLVARGMTEPDARARIAAQAGRARRLAAADLVVSNDGDRVDLADRVRELWAGLAARAVGSSES